MDDKPLDCLVVGAGPAGLTAAIYLARFHLDILVVDSGKGRAATIPCTHNHAGYPDGISGKELIARMKEQAQRYGAKIVDGCVTRIERNEEDGPFCADWGSGPVAARIGAAGDRRDQSAPADGRGASRRCARSVV